MNQKEKRQGVDVGSGLVQVCSVADWYQYGHFKNEEEARGAFVLAHQQGLDGMGKSIPEWMGLSETEFNSWINDGSLPRGRRRKRRK